MTTPQRKICVITGTRAEYGLLFWLLKEIETDPALELQLVVTGSHLEDRFGHTVDQIIADGFAIAEQVDIDLADDSPVGISRSMGLCTTGMGQAFNRLGPDIIVVLGDRFEILAAAQAAMVARIPIAHIHGGEATEGLIDEAIRHAVTKMSHLHFVAADAYARRVIQLGEAPDRVFVTGTIGLDHLARLDPVPREELEKFLDIALSAPLFVTTYHPVTLSDADPAGLAGELTAALETFGDATIIVTGVNADTGNDSVRRVFDGFAADHKETVRLVESLGSRRYLSMLKIADVVIGNSSSGIIEAPAVGTVTVNIGDRQRGRLRAGSIIDCDDDQGSIIAAIGEALDPAFRKNLKNMNLSYAIGNTSRAICGVLRDADLNGILFKRFHDLEPLR